MTLLPGESRPYPAGASVLATSAEMDRLRRMTWCLADALIDAAPDGESAARIACWIAAGCPDEDQDA